ncbi:MAG: hypothetical protein U5L98_17120 [Halomonas sp.]|uniref:hypothetical protein n=1 Tax=Halomonas sp. TaxID=1486246 RepID=UPI002ACE3B42|nr:hypothetical protein [Halomonas sp.]MDZ7854298.1 hypothetical protein [Halomonas sp.]
MKNKKLKRKEVEVSELFLENQRKEKELLEQKEKFRIIIDEYRSDGDSIRDMISEMRKLIKDYQYNKLAIKKQKIYGIMRRLGEAYDEILEKTGIPI